jgi:Uma2 family endonuclease
MSNGNTQTAEIYYPSSDGKPMAETDVHLLLMVALISSLRHYGKAKRDWYVIGDMFLYYQEGHPELRRAPDIMVVKGVDPTIQRRSFKTWVEGAVPRAIFELTSKETAGEDQQEKKLLYEQLKIREYFLFDPLCEYLPRQLMGYSLVGRRYKALKPDDQGALLSKELGLRLVPEGTNLALVDVQSGQRLPTPDDLSELVTELQQQTMETAKEHRRLVRATRRAEQQAAKDRQRAEQEKQRAEEEKQRADTLAAEVASLRAHLHKLSE